MREKTERLIRRGSGVFPNPTGSILVPRCWRNLFAAWRPGAVTLLGLQSCRAETGSKEGDLWLSHVELSFRNLQAICDSKDDLFTHSFLPLSRGLRDQWWASLCLRPGGLDCGGGLLDFP